MQTRATRPAGSQAPSRRAAAGEEEPEGSRRNHTPEAVETETLEEEQPDPLIDLSRQEGETLETHTTRLRAEVAKRQLLEENARLLRILTNTPVTLSLEAAEAQASHKRNASTALMQERPKLVKFSDPPTFEGKSVKQLDEFHRRWTVYFDADDSVTTHDSRIRTAAAGLRGEALPRYLRAKESDETLGWTWDDFITHLRDAIVDPVNRTANVQIKLKELKQGDRQSVNAVLAQLEQLESELPGKLTTEEQRAWTLLVCYKPAIRNAILRDIPTHEYAPKSQPRRCVMKAYFETKRGTNRTVHLDHRRLLNEIAPRSLSAS